ncbi:MAG TPA: hypothetical protein VE954_11625 [Oligoflexus sp.]|uniref:hypothetical protein n=1 Tax=Oligoflexus sp. TaxID=1971216 RepID=UPI002D67DA00|nr:hypothetical protein [Oligoflexus sp.]HYX33754.1 hypothetical protein [Oligoflexus sp.]
MRSAMFALMTTLWFTTSPGLARNGETGILIMVQTFEFVKNDQAQITTLVLCSADMARISKLLEEGIVTNIYLPGYGVFEVEATEAGEIMLYQKDIEILFRECEPVTDASC